MTTLILITSVVLIGISIIVLVRSRAIKPKGHSISAVRKQVGLSFTEYDDAILDKIKFFKMYDVTTRNASARNVFRSTNPPPDICVFDYEATTGTEDTPVTETHTTFYFRDDRMVLPGFRLLPENSDIARRNDSVLKYRPITFASHPVFSSRFRLVGPDGHEIRAFFSPDICSFFEKLDAVCVEGFKSELLVYLPKKKVTPDDFQKYFIEARTIFDLLLNRSAMMMHTSETVSAPSL